MKYNKEITPNRFEGSKKNLINIDIEETDRAVYGGAWRPKTSEQELALELALTLQDRKGLAFYISCTSKYPEAFLREIVHKVMSIPDQKIKRSRGALFNYLVQEGPSSSTDRLSPTSTQDVHDFA